MSLREQPSLGQRIKGEKWATEIPGQWGWDWR